jgi:hypothetical protein
MLHDLRLFSVTTELGTKSRKSEVFFPVKSVMDDIGRENFAWMNYTFHKVSSQIDVNVTSFDRINCFDKECDFNDKKDFQLFQITVEVFNVGFSPASNVEADIQGR